MEDKANKAWTDLIQEYQIDNAIKQHGEFIIQAKDIKKYREPRLMAKWDSSESLPTILKKSDINILLLTCFPISSCISHSRKMI